MTFSVIKGVLSAAVADGGTFTASYPAGKNEGSFYLAMKHELIIAGDRYVFPDDFDVTLGTSDITVTNNSSTTWPIDSSFSLQMEEPGDRQFREDYGPNITTQKANLIASMVRGAVGFINLGAPDILDTDGIVDAGTADDSVNTPTLLKSVFDVPRTLSALGSSGSNHVITIKGTDVYGRDMTETLTLDGTNKQWGNKAFKTINDPGGVVVAAGATGDTYDLGYEDFLGLPVFMPSDAHVIGLMQDGVLMPKRHFASTYIEEVALLAATSQFMLTPYAGFITKANSVVSVGVTTGGALTVEIGGTAVVGLSVVVANSAGAGDIDTDTPTTVDGTDTTLRVAAGSDIEIVIDSAFATGGTLEASVEINTTGIIAAGIRTANGSTATTGDVRGTFMPPVACDGNIVFQLAVMLPDPGFTGIPQFVS